MTEARRRCAARGCRLPLVSTTPPYLSSLVLVVAVVVCPDAQLLFLVAVLPPSSPWTYCVLPLVVVVEPSEVVAVAVAREPLPLPSGSLSAAASSAPRLRRHA
ncbi:hypothetical protein E2562_012517 [Oryza meyeriana var. granulata]|uniref:Uncharacterized protein n=1 Tax=Oryza meyeriana var. granulata TaxID=110450 RepID=A0A6G1BVU1_9ORYZ|nr:hypothetical protein E2562_012517 [Oryza meyeriana var. granulata]